PKLAMTKVITGAEVIVPLEELINLDDEIARLTKELKKYQGEVKLGEGKLGNEKFVNSAPEAVVEAEREKLADWQAKAAVTQQRLAELKTAQA
ncbi:valine--tRNA ligase, partial [Weissella thailandensis]